MDPKAESDFDLTNELEAFFNKYPGARKPLVAPLNSRIARGDGMHSGDAEYYFLAGSSALNLVLDALRTPQLQFTPTRAILDYACGFGRVTRWLHACFPEAHLRAADLDAKACAAIRRVIDVPTQELTKDLSRSLPERYDIIWIGSLFTHIDLDEVKRVLGFLVGHLTEQGVIVATTHGAYVASRLQSREKTYNLSEAGIERLIAQFALAGHGFTPYNASAADYGISLVSPPRMMDAAATAGLECLMFRARGWVKHQDCFAFRRASSDA